MTTFGDMQAEIASEVKRSNLGDEIKRAIQEAIRHYEKNNWWFMQDFQESVTVLTEWYALPTDFKKEITLSMTYSGVTEPLEFRGQKWFREHYTNGVAESGVPVDWTYEGAQFRLGPVANGIYPLRLDYYRKFDPLVGVNDTNAWLDEPYDLIKARARAKLWGTYIRNVEEMAVAKAEEQEALNAIYRRNRQMTSRGRIRPRS